MVLVVVTDSFFHVQVIGFLIFKEEYSKLIDWFTYDTFTVNGQNRYL